MNPAFVDAAAQVFLDPWLWLIVLGSAVYGIFIGAVPGLTATMAMALMVPLTYWLDPIPALAAIVTLEACAIYAGDIPSTLLRIPGTPASAAYTEDAYGLTLQRPGRAGDGRGAGLKCGRRAVWRIGADAVGVSAGPRGSLVQHGGVLLAVFAGPELRGGDLA